MAQIYFDKPKIPAFGGPPPHQSDILPGDPEVVCYIRVCDFTLQLWQVAMVDALIDNVTSGISTEFIIEYATAIGHRWWISVPRKVFEKQNRDEVLTALNDARQQMVHRGFAV